MGNNEARERKGGEPKNPPIHTIRAALREAKYGRPYYGSGTPDQFRTNLLASLHLSGEKQDGWSMADRVLGTGRDTSLVVDIGTMFITIKSINSLLDATAKGTANPMQESLTHDLAAVAVRQLERERTMCPMAAKLVMRTPDRFISDPAIKARASVGLKPRQRR